MTLLEKLRILTLAGLATLTSGGMARTVNLLVPGTGYVLHPAIAYGGDPRQMLDVYVPKDAHGPLPVLLFLYGGNWESGSRELYRGVGQAFASAGVLTVVADYRLYPKVKYPAFVQDAAAAMVWVHSHAKEYGGDPGRVFISGHSAGAYNAIMAASDPDFLKAAGGDISWIKGAIGISGPYDFLPLTGKDYIDMFHGPDNADTMPITHITGPRAPMLLVTGGADDVVGPGNSARMAARMHQMHNEAEFREYPGVGHIGIIMSLLPLFAGRTTLKADMLDFIHAH